ncbi:DUF4817 domain-containing protein [Trichonephila clavipes]|nr:DUF4817 domain-containing protein [Trichonephila clavipes]
MYTNEEYCEIVLLYGQCNQKKREVARLYAIKFPSRRHPSYCTIASAVQRLFKLGVVIDVFSYLVPPLRRIPAEDVAGYTLAHPESSVRDISKACSYSKSMAWNILHTYVRCISLSSSPGTGTNARRPGASV